MNSRIIVFFAFSILFFASCSSEKKEKTVAKVYEKVVTEPKPDSLVAKQQYLVKPGWVGQFRIGMPSDSLPKMVAPENLKKIEVELEGTKSFAYEIRNKQNGGQLLLTAEENCAKTCTIFRIRIQNPKFQTADSIRVGSTFGELQKKYHLSYIGIGEADFVAVSEKNKMTFALDISGFPPKPLYKIKAEDIPENTPVTGILLY